MANLMPPGQTWGDGAIVRRDYYLQQLFVLEREAGVIDIGAIVSGFREQFARFALGVACELDPTDPLPQLSQLEHCALAAGGTPTLPTTEAYDAVSGLYAAEGCAGGGGVSPIACTNDFSVVAMIFGTGTSTSNDIFEGFSCSVDDVCYHASWMSGESPMLFFTSPVPTELVVRVVPRRGVVTYADPPQVGGAWRITATTEATPLYYEFDAGVLAQLPFREDEGWSVPAADAETTLRALLRTWGYDGREVDVFLARDVHGKLPSRGSVEIRAFETATLDRMLPLIVTPVPTRIERLFFHLRVTESPRALRAPDTSAFEHAGASGLTAREFGAVISGG